MKPGRKPATDFPGVSRQRRYQLRRLKQGLCIQCGKPREHDTILKCDAIVPAATPQSFKKQQATTCAVLLQGIRNPLNQYGVENGYAPHRFRELEEDEEVYEKEYVNAVPQVVYASKEQVKIER